MAVTSTGSTPAASANFTKSSTCPREKLEFVVTLKQYLRGYFDHTNSIPSKLTVGMYIGSYGGPRGIVMPPDRPLAPDSDSDMLREAHKGALRS